MRKTALTLVLLLVGGQLYALEHAHATTVTVTATVVTSCNNGTIEMPETCDGGNLGGATCTTLGFSGGSLSCKSNCVYETGSCTSSGGGGVVNNVAGGGGGGGGASLPAISSTGAVFSGRAYPKSSVTLLKDSQVVASTVAGEDARFEISLTGLSPGNYLFSLYSEDERGYRSSLSTFPLSVTAGATLGVSGIFIAPTITTDAIEVRRGDIVTIFGKGAPGSEVTISVASDEPLFFRTSTGADGAYLYRLKTTTLESGDHLAKARLAAATEVSAFGKTVEFKVGSRTVLRPERSPVTRKGDLNKDGRVNVIDFSILAYWYKRPNPRADADLSGDGKVNIIDFSILAFHWTG